jgi:hypothetical protein
LAYNGLVTDAGVDELRKALPKCRIDYTPGTPGKVTGGIPAVGQWQESGEASLRKK